ncbi:YlbF family regulator [Haloplanus rubicundus]|uniref:YlbF family regulator n=1 Tax=Haloplanus rubicundus TaxID=1547898 RepID=A0A345ED91_9EURY|nr:YlbF family regulator [Haloplanus rubicundus]AXG06788.1 YlbF family regulator [Haloplanus rubicundus]AXG10163.1 YlbF family regulator [Haloplanus rubicundus]
MSTQVSQLEAMGRELGEAIADTPAYERFEEARAAVQDDDDAQAKIAEVERLRDEFVAARETGEATQEHVAKLQQAQNELHSMDVMVEYLNAQEALQSQLEAINVAISEPLSVDFGGEAGGCCQD